MLYSSSEITLCKILSVDDYSSLIQINLHNTFLITFYQESILSDNTVHNENPKRSIADNFDQNSVYSQSGREYKYDNKKKRTELGQLLQILEYIWSSNNTQISSIARSNNMSHDAATRNCEKLVSVGLVAGETSHDTKRYRLTSQGRSFLDDCRNFEDILCKYNLCHALYH